jgi:hypothetical protein
MMDHVITIMIVNKSRMLNKPKHGIDNQRLQIRSHDVQF